MWEYLGTSCKLLVGVFLVFKFAVQDYRGCYPEQSTHVSKVRHQIHQTRNTSHRKIHIVHDLCYKELFPCLVLRRRRLLHLQHLRQGNTTLNRPSVHRRRRLPSILCFTAICLPFRFRIRHDPLLLSVSKNISPQFPHCSFVPPLDLVWSLTQQYKPRPCLLFVGRGIFFSSELRESLVLIELMVLLVLPRSTGCLLLDDGLGRGVSSYSLQSLYLSATAGVLVVPSYKHKQNAKCQVFLSIKKQYKINTR